MNKPARKKQMQREKALRVVKPRPAPARVNTVNTYEVQARDASRRILSGEQDVARILSHVTPAAPMPSMLRDGGRPIPFDLLAMLEAAFGAELDAVRLHDDAQAHHAADREGARAFAAGRDIYFNEGEYQPSSVDGQRLIAHEVAHVLQQTSQRGADDQLAARDITGGGAIQAEDKPPEKEYKWTDFKAEYVKFGKTLAEPLKADVEKALAELETVATHAELGGMLSLSRGAKEVTVKFEEKVVKGDFDTLDINARMTLYDALKLLGLYKGAAHLLKLDVSMQSIARGKQEMADFLDHDPAYGPDWIISQVDKIPALKGLYPDRALQMVWRYLTRPATDPQGVVEYDQAFKKYVEDFNAQLKAGSLLGDNEFVGVAYKLLASISDKLKENLKRLEMMYEDVPRATRRYLIAQYMPTFLKPWLNEPLELWHKLYDGIIPLAAAAEKMWSMSRTLYSDISGTARAFFDATHPPAGATEGTPTLPEVPKAPKDIKNEVNFKAFTTAAGTALSKIVFNTKDEPLRKIDDYAKTRDDAVKTLEAHRAPLSERLGAVFQRTQLNTTDPKKLEAMFEKAKWYGWTLVLLDELLKQLNEYDPEKDREFENTYKTPDVRLYHRYHVATMGYWIGLVIENKVLIDAMTLILSGGDQTTSYMAFTGNWEEEDYDHPIAVAQSLTEDLPGNEVIVNVGLTPYEVARIYELLFTIFEVGNLEALLADEETDLDPTTLNLASRAIDAAIAGMPMPRKWVPKDHLIVWKDGDETYLNTAEMIFAHSRYPELLIISGGQADEWVGPSGRGIKAFLWQLPKFENIASYLLNNEEIVRILKKGAGELPVNAENLRLILEGMADRAAAALGINLQSTSEIDAAREERRGLITRAMTHDRRVLQKMLTDDLGRYAKDHLKEYSTPNRVIDMLDQFKRVNEPPRSVKTKAEDPIQKARREAQVAALVLGLAPAMYKAFINDDKVLGIFDATSVENRFDMITGFWEYISLGIQFAQGKTLPPELAGLTPPPTPKSILKAIVHQDENVDLLLAGAPILEKLRGHLEAAITAVQMQFGFRTNGSKSALTRHDQPREMKLNSEPYMVDGVSYIITHIERDFVYYEPYGKGTPAYKQSILREPDNADGNPGKDIERSRNLVLFKYLQGDNEVEVTADMGDDDLLIHMSHVVTMGLIAEGLAELAEMIETSTQFIVEGAALLLPGGQVVLTAAQLAQFMLVEWPTIQEELLNAPYTVVQKLYEFISPEKRAEAIEHLWMYLLFEGSLPFVSTIKEKLGGMGKSSKSSVRPKSGKFAKLAAFAKKVLTEIVEAFIKFREALQHSLIKAQQVVVRIPILKSFLNAVPVLIELASAIEPGYVLESQTFAEMLGEGVSVKTIEDGLGEMLDNLFTGLNDLILPEEIIPIEVVVDAITDMFLLALGAKGKVLRKVMQTAPGATIKGFFVDEISKAIRESGYDPNVLWRDQFQKEMKAVMDQARHDLTDGVNQVLHGLFGDMITIPYTGLEAPDVTYSQEKLELEPYAEDEAEFGGTGEKQTRVEQQTRVDADPPDVEYEGGMPLAPSMLAFYEDLYGHDFAHVRLHTGRGAHQLTGYYGAQALTSGSHIYLSRDHMPGSPRTDHILRHELAHVLQQAGARPKALPSDPEPVPGAFGRGLVKDNRREIAAEDMARETITRKPDEAIAVEEEGRTGFQPAAGKSAAVAARLLRALNDQKIPKAYVNDINTLKTIPSSVSGAPGFTQAYNDANAIWTKVSTLLKAAKSPASLANKSPFHHQEALDSIAKLFKETVTIDKPILRALTFNSHKKKRGKRDVYLDVGDFVDNLARYLYGRTGLILNIDKVNPPTHAQVTDVEIGLLSGHTTMWKNIAANSKKHAPASKWTDKEWSKVRAIILGGGFEKEPWHTTEFRLGDAFMKEMEEILRATGGGTADTWADYIKPYALNIATGGMRVGTHGQLTADSARPTSIDFEPATPAAGGGAMHTTARPGRQSHHVPQYLLVEYFRNNNKSKLIKSVDSKKTVLPGFETSSGVPTSVTDGTEFDKFDMGAGSINFARLDPSAGRGTGLPAVSLGAYTHQQGKLHLNAAAHWASNPDADGKLKPSDVELKGSDTQGMRFERAFYEYVAREMKLSGSKPEAIVKEANKKPAESKPKIYKAIKSTYKWMYELMMYSLKDALRREEIMYYNGIVGSIAAAKDAKGNFTPPYTADPGTTSVIVDAVKAKNDTIMKEWK